jgi:hypothetical protein
MDNGSSLPPLQNPPTQNPKRRRRPVDVACTTIRSGHTPHPTSNNKSHGSDVEEERRPKPLGTRSADPAGEFVGPAVQISPANIVKRRALARGGIAVEIIQAASHEKVEYNFRAP